MSAKKILWGALPGQLHVILLRSSPREFELEERTSMKRLAISALLAAGMIVPKAMAQKNELSGLVGRTFITDQTIKGSTQADNKLRFGDGLSFEANYARRLMTAQLLSLSFEVPFILNPDEDLHAALPTRIPANYKSYIVTPAARVNIFPDLGVSPWVSIGGGINHNSESSSLLFGGKNPGQTGNTTGVFQIGAGLDVRLIRRFSLRAEVRDFWAGVPPVSAITDTSRQHNLFAGAGLVWHF
jgi:hypothetical protein